jgi:hypothetical protein
MLSKPETLITRISSPCSFPRAIQSGLNSMHFILDWAKVRAIDVELLALFHHPESPSVHELGEF